MDPRLPHPDPHESLGMEPGEAVPMKAPTAVFVMSRPSAETDRASDAILDLRPGVLIVVAPHRSFSPCPHDAPPRQAVDTLPWADTRMIHVDATSFFAVVLVAAVAATTVAVVPRGYAPPVVVVELLLGILIGPQVLDIAQTDDFIAFFS